MQLEIAGVALSALILSAWLTSVVRRIAPRYGLVDIPNARSSHTKPTPRGGGLAIVASMLLASCALVWLDAASIHLLIALFGGGTAVAVVGLLDDRHKLSVRVRLAAHFGAALWALAWLGGLPPLQIGAAIVNLGWAGYVLGALVIVWALNLFNFMDGIDGIAAMEAVFILIAASVLAVVIDRAGPVVGASAALSGCCCGFLLWNWPPAKIFMGDVGSGFIGYAIAVLAIAAARESPVAPFVWLILGAAFFVDATVTLGRRLLRGERVFDAHRSHAYQWLARRSGSHRRATLVVLAVNLLLLLPSAVVATMHPSLAVWIWLIVLAPLAAAALAIGAGKSG